MINSEPPLPSNRKFGAFFTIIFLVLSGYAYRRDAHLLATICILLTLVFFMVTATAPTLLGPLNRLWFELGLFLGKIISPIVLGGIFFVLIVPVALVTRAFGRDELHLRRRASDSYWINRTPPGPAPESFKYQF